MPCRRSCGAPYRPRGRDLKASMGENTLRALASDLAYLAAWAKAATGDSLPWPVPEALALKFVASRITFGISASARQVRTMTCRLKSPGSADQGPVAARRFPRAGDGAAAACELGDPAPLERRYRLLRLAGAAHSGPAR